MHKKIACLLIVALCLAVSTQAAPASCTGGFTSVSVMDGQSLVKAGGVTFRYDLARQVAQQVNAERARWGLSQLRIDSELTRAAAVRAEEIVRKFSHTRPDGRSWHSVSDRAYAENIAMGQRTADKVMAAWLTSAGHRANMLRASYGSIGVCACVSNGVVYWVQLFGK